ncbi:DNA-3-methyladenine glycosylase family protein [Taibaiella koreensis]|uniref:DNA-3-methyladenine glycosylase family protein n=1 Tax=Taibaiella koreensis TaxID=1268548 RepID=UPI000E59C38F|nr:DNA glycosylase [Taibaiella koreensis]
MSARNTFDIPIPALFNFAECCWFLDRGYDDCLHQVRDGALIKALAVEGKPLLLRITGADASLEVTVLKGKLTTKTQNTVERYVREWFDLDRDLQPFYTLLDTEKKLAYMSHRYSGLRLMGIPDLFEALCWSIIGQQINLSFAYRLKRRLTERYGTSIDYEGQSYFIFPGPEALTQAPVEALKEMQFSGMKARYLTELAAVFASGAMSRTLLEQLPSFATQQQALMALRGIGVWTANYALMKSLRAGEAIPYGDVGLLQALVGHQLISDRKDQVGIDRLFGAFSGWESYLVFYLWRSMAEPAK